MKIKHIQQHIQSLKHDISIIASLLNSNHTNTDRELYLANSKAFSQEVERLQKLIDETEIEVELPLVKQESR